MLLEFQKKKRKFRSAPQFCLRFLSVSLKFTILFPLVNPLSLHRPRCYRLKFILLFCRHSDGAGSAVCPASVRRTWPLAAPRPPRRNTAVAAAACPAWWPQSRCPARAAPYHMRWVLFFLWLIDLPSIYWPKFHYLLNLLVFKYS